METKEQERPPQNGTDKPRGFVPAAPRGVLKTGMPTSGYWVIAGLPKGGKTTLAASIPGAYIIEREKGGADRVSGWIQDAPDMGTFREALKFGFQDPSVRVIVVDTLDAVLRDIGQESAAKFGLDSLSDKREGVNGFAVWEEVFARVDRMMSAFRDCGKLVILLAHFKEAKLDSDGKLVVTQAIDAPSSKMSSHICAGADVIGVCSKKRIGDKSQYSVKFHGDGVVGAYGSRLPELEDRTIMLPATNQWAAIEAAFKTPKAEPEKKPEPAPKKAEKKEAGKAGGK